MLIDGTRTIIRVIIYTDLWTITAVFIDGQRIKIAVPALFGAERDVYVEGGQLLPLDNGGYCFYLIGILYPRADLHPAVQVDGVWAYGLDRIVDVLRV